MAQQPHIEANDKGSAQGDMGASQFQNNFFYNQLSQQQRMQAAMQQRDHLSMVRDQQRNDSILAAAVQQQLVASLSSPSIPLFPLGGQPALGGELSGGLLSRSGPPNSFLHGLPGASSRGYFGMPGGSSKPDALMETSTGKRQTSTQISCQARGMSTDHNSVTAYFDIRIDATHGQHLYCSHPSCRASGVKFRYCLHCKKPVTKQNFRSRHLHSDLERFKDLTTGPVIAGKKRKSEDLGSSSSNGAGGMSSTNRTAPHGNLHTMRVPSTLSSFAAVMKASAPVDPMITIPIKGSTMMKTTNLVNGLSQWSQREDSSTFKAVSRRRRWASLLAERPQSLQGIDVWVTKVLYVSDSGRPWRVSPSALADGSISPQNSVEQLSKWNALLDERPAGVEQGANVTSWISRLFEVSCIDYEPSTSVTSTIPSPVTARVKQEDESASAAKVEE